MNLGVAQSGQVELFDHFTGATEPGWLSTQDTSTGGSPTVAPVNAAGGAFRLRQDAQNEVQALTLYGGDVLSLGGASEPVFEARVKVDLSTGTALAAEDTIVFGLGSARDATLDDMTTNFWFRLEGANNNILWEYDDGTTDDDDNDSGVDWVDGTYVVYRIDMSDLSAVKFFVDGDEVASVDVSATITDSNLLQPFFEVQKTAATTANGIDIDYCYLRSQVIR